MFDKPELSLNKIPDVVVKPFLSKALLFSNKITEIMKENTPDSYRFVVCDEDKILGSGVGGFSRMTIDPPETPAKLNDRLIIASMSKTITAVAVLSTLQSKNLSPDTSVAPFFPSDWQLHDEVKKLTFRDFLTHRTGFYWDGKTAFQDGTDYESMKKIVAQKPFNPIKTGYSYRNINFAIFRVILPYLNAYDRFSKKVTLITLSNTSLDASLAQSYINLVNQRVLSPSGIASAACTSNTLVPPSGAGGRPAPQASPLPVLAYHYQKPSQKGIDGGDQTLYCGASGWALSVGDIAKVLQTALFTEVVLSEKSRDLMLAPGALQNNGLGMNMDMPLAGSNVYSHGAWIPYEKDAPPDGAQLAGWYLYFEKTKLIVVALSNSGHKPGAANWFDRVKQAYVEIYGV